MNRQGHHMRLSEISACGNSLSDWFSGKWWSVLLNPAMKWFLNVRLARSAALWHCGDSFGWGASW
jgi:hypothetical protein